MIPAGLYIHIPFCRRICPYCHFYKKLPETDDVEAFLWALGEEMRLRAEEAPFIDSIYLGGGSPSLLSSRQLARIMETVHDHFRVSAKTETTMEANPDDLTLEKLRGFRQSGINRISLGVQSFQEKDLAYLQRTHGAQAGLRTISRAQEAGYTNISIDLMIGIPGQCEKQAGQNIEEVKKRGIPHVSLYILERVRGKPCKSGRNLEANLYLFCRQRLIDLGYPQYEISNFSRPGFHSRHNLKYWKNLSYIGLGPSASSFLGGIDSCNNPNLFTYIGRLREGKLPLRQKRKIPESLRRLITGMRLVGGISSSAFTAYEKELSFLMENGILRQMKKRISLVPEYYLLLNEILGYFV